ncbi:unnamed protein product [Ectocarpus fasciculatus]
MPWLSDAPALASFPTIVSCCTGAGGKGASGARFFESIYLACLPIWQGYKKNNLRASVALLLLLWKHTPKILVGIKSINSAGGGCVTGLRHQKFELHAWSLFCYPAD